MRKRAPAVGSKNDKIDPRTFCLRQYQIRRDPLEFYRSFDTSPVEEIIS